jgi:hypothetical protein
VAEAKAKDERKKLDKKAKERLLHYERLVENAVQQRSGTPTYLNSDQPLHRTCVVNGNRSVEIVEFTQSTATPYTSPNPLASAFLQEALGAPTTMIQNDNSRTLSRFNQSCGSASPLQSSQPPPLQSTHNLSNTQPDQQILLLPSSTDRASSRVSELQSSLAKIGINAQIETVEFDTNNELFRPQYSENDIVRSSLFWEAPSLKLGSELLDTLRKFGWKPSYARSSGTFLV